MKERFVEITAPEGRMQAFVTQPEEAGPFPAVVVYADVFGPREELFDVARRVGTVGHYVMVPNFYYRHGSPRVTLPDKRGWTLKDLGAGEEQKVRAAGKALTNAMAVDDTAAILKFLEREPVRPGPKGAIGFCMGGRHALCVAGRHPDHFRATAILHGSTLVSDDPASPRPDLLRVSGKRPAGADCDDRRARQAAGRRGGEISLRAAHGRHPRLRAAGPRRSPQAGRQPRLGADFCHVPPANPASGSSPIGVHAHAPDRMKRTPMPGWRGAGGDRASKKEDAAEHARYDWAASFESSLGVSMLLSALAAWLLPAWLFARHDIAGMGSAQGKFIQFLRSWLRARLLQEILSATRRFPPAPMAATVPRLLLRQLLLGFMRDLYLTSPRRLGSIVTDRRMRSRVVLSIPSSLGPNAWFGLFSSASP